MGPGFLKDTAAVRKGVNQYFRQLEHIGKRIEKDLETEILEKMIEIAENRVTTGFREARKKLNKNREKIEKLKTEIKEMEVLS